MNLADFSNAKLEQSKPFNLIFPDGSVTDAKIYIKSMKSKAVLREIDNIQKRLNQSLDQGAEAAVKSDVDMACVIIDTIENMTITAEANVFGFELDGENIVSTKENIRILMENFHFARQQVSARAGDDGFFYLDKKS